MKKTILLTFSFYFVLSLTSCRKDAPELKNPNTINPQTYTEQFQAVWDGMSTSYVFWDVDTVDWDARYDECIHLFENFDARGTGGTVTDEEYQKAWDQVFSGLVDHHLTAFLWNPRNQKRASVHPGKNSYSHVDAFKEQAAILKSMPGVSEMVMNEDPAAGPIAYACLLPGKPTTGKKIAYFRFNGFEYDPASNSAAGLAPLYAFFGSDSNGITDDAYANRSDVESVIVDVRGNGGGNVSNIVMYIATLIQDSVNLGYVRTKENLGRLDHSPWMKFPIPSRAKHLKEAKPIVVLADINSVSCAEMTTLLIKSIPNGTFIGERTHGGTGALLANPKLHKVFYSGGFGDQDLFELVFNETPMGEKSCFAYYVYTSTYEMVDVNYNSLEGKGVQPDIEELFDPTALAAGRDNQMERALEFLRK